MSGQNCSGLLLGGKTGFGVDSDVSRGTFFGRNVALKSVEISGRDLTRRVKMAAAATDHH